MARASILVTTDLSVRSDRSVDRGLALANQLDMDALVLHVIDGRTARPAAHDRVIALFMDDFGPLAPGARFTTEFGESAEVIANVAARNESPIVVAGVSHLNEAKDLVLGTTVERLVRESPAPVLVVKRRPRKPYDRLLIASDLSESSREALETAARLFPAAALRMIHVYRAPFQGFLNRESVIDYTRSQAECELNHFLRKLAPQTRRRLDVVLQEGETISGAIADAASDWVADLVVAGSHGRSGIAHALIGSRAVEILDFVPLDTLVVRARGLP